MAVRPIDGNALIEWFRPYLHTGEAIPADVVIEDIRSMPTLTPQNEPLTLGSCGRHRTGKSRIAHCKVSAIERMKLPAARRRERHE